MVWIKEKRINLVVQQGTLRKQFPNASSSIKRSRLTWVGDLTPSPLSQTYRLRLDYKLDARPKVHLVSPKLERREGRLPPHLFPEERLCLNLPYEWSGDMLLVDTIIPWTAEWLLHYEIWLATGEWCGGGTHPGDQPKEESEPRQGEGSIPRRGDPRQN